MKPAAPSGLSAHVISCNQIDLAWSDNSGNEEGYKVYRNGVYVGHVGMNGNSYHDTGLSGNTSYSYYVRAYRGGIQSDASNTASVTTPSCPVPGDAYEPDDSSAQANWISSGTSQTHSIVPADDVDWVKFSLDVESGVLLETSGVGGDTRMWLYDSNLRQVDFDDDSGNGRFSKISWQCGTRSLVAGTYYVKIDEFGNDNEISAYDVTLASTPCPPPSTLTPTPTRTPTWTPSPTPVRPHLVYDHYRVGSDDDGDGRISPGDHIGLIVGVRNVGSAAADSAWAKLESSNPNVMITDAWTFLGDINPDEVIESLSDYLDFEISDTATPGTTIGFTLHLVENQGGAWDDYFSITVAQPPSPTPSVTPRPAPATYIYREAETAALTAPMTTAQDVAASACYYVYTPHSWGDSTVTLQFSTPKSAEYVIWSRVMGLDWGQNSFWVSIDGGTEFHFEIGQDNGEAWDWHWQKVANDIVLGPFHLNVGTHTLRFREREKNSRLDRLLITNDTVFVPTEGNIEGCRTSSSYQAYLPVLSK